MMFAVLDGRVGGLDKTLECVPAQSRVGVVLSQWLQSDYQWTEMKIFNGEGWRKDGCWVICSDAPVHEKHLQVEVKLTTSVGARLPDPFDAKDKLQGWAFGGAAFFVVELGLTLSHLFQPFPNYSPPTPPSQDAIADPESAMQATPLAAGALGRRAAANSLCAPLTHPLRETLHADTHT